QQTMGLSGLLDRHPRPDDRPDASVRDHRPDRARPLRDDGALTVGPSRWPPAQRGADDSRTFAEQLGDVEFTVDPALHADDDQLAIVGQGVDVAVQVRAPNDVKDNVATGAAG